MIEVNRKQQRVFQFLRLGLLGLFLCAFSLPAFSQGCALCYTQAASSGARMIAALKSGILVLIAPPTFMSLVVIGICYRKSGKFRAPAAEAENNGW